MGELNTPDFRNGDAENFDNAFGDEADQTAGDTSDFEVSSGDDLPF